jgi:hypothetical protein
MFVLSVAQYPTAPVRNAGKIAQKLFFSFCSATGLADAPPEQDQPAEQQ